MAKCKSKVKAWRSKTSGRQSLEAEICSALFDTFDLAIGVVQKSDWGNFDRKLHDTQTHAFLSAAGGGRALKSDGCFTRLDVVYPSAVNVLALLEGKVDDVRSPKVMGQVCVIMWC